jgi:hypothetical protein
MKQNETNFSQKIPKNFCCENCNYLTSSNKDYNKHLATVKHLKLANETNETKMKLEIPENFKCFCGIVFGSRTTLWRHKKKCFESNNEIQKNEIIDKEEKNEPTDKEIIMMLIKDNSEFKNIMMKVLENGTHNNNNNHTNSHNKSFNLQFFLNETCKDAMNMMEFVDSIKLQLSDLERVGELGYVEGISNIIVDNLKALDITQRPVHCTDKKRETLYIKDENKWEKDEEKKKMHTMVKKIAHKNARLLPKFKEEHPDCGKSSSKFSDQYNKIIVESMGGPGDNDYEKEEKIIKKVSKEVIVEKEQVEL